jgi:hypothetical protein
MENENVKVHPVKRFFKAVGKALPDILMFVSIYFLVFLLIFGLVSALETDTKADVLSAENDYLKGQSNGTRRSCRMSHITGACHYRR